MPNVAYKNPTAQETITNWCRLSLAGWSTPHETTEMETYAGPTHLTWVGQSSAPLVLYLPGTNFNAATSRDEIDVLATRFRVVVPDVPGQPGLSTEIRPSGARLSYYGYWLDDVLDQLDQDVYVVGHSLGAAIALSAQSPRIRARALLNPAGLIRMRTPPRLLWATTRWLTRPSTDNTRRLLGLLAGPTTPPTPQHVEWMTLLTHHTHTTWAPRPLPQQTLHTASVAPMWIGLPSDDIFLPAPRLRSAAANLNATLEDHAAGHLPTTTTISAATTWLANLPKPRTNTAGREKMQ